MKLKKNLFFYLLIVGVFSVFIIGILHTGEKLETGRILKLNNSSENHFSIFSESFRNNLLHPLALLLIQIVTIILVSRLFGWFCKKLGQPVVIGEIAAGIALGPSLAGAFLPIVGFYLFPQQSLSNLYFLSQIGLILFMFVIGMEVDLKELRNQAHEAVVVSHASIIIPFTLGIALSYFMYNSFAPKNTQFLSFSLFLGISMSITAFPVLARIVQERGIYKSKLGNLVITCAAVDDITAWSLLAAVIAIIKAGSFLSSLPVILIAIVYVVIMLYVVKPFLKRVGELNASQKNLSKSIIALFFLMLLLSSYTTEIIGIHALFGAFMAGTVMPDNKKFKQIFIEKVEDIALVLLLPLFFVYTGLRTQIGLLNSPGLWAMCGIIILVAIIGKFGGSAFAARIVGHSWKDSLTIGALMNTRGLVELVALNIGYDLGILTPEVFSMLVIMALFTTFMTTPALDLIDKFTKSKVQEISEVTQILAKFRILISFGRPEMGGTLLRLTDFFSKNVKSNTVITALHLFPGNLFNNIKIENYELSSFKQVDVVSRKLRMDVKKTFRISENINDDITEEANSGNYDLMLIGMGQSIFQGSMLGRILGYLTNIVEPNLFLSKFRKKDKIITHSGLDERTRQILADTRIPVGVLLDKGLNYVETILLPITNYSDTFLFDYAKKFIRNSNTRILIFDIYGIIKSDPGMRESIMSLELSSPDYIRIINENESENDFISQTDLILISLKGWADLIKLKRNWLQNNHSVLIIKP